MNWRQQRVDFGLAMEKELKPLIEQVVDEPLVKTGNTYDTMDFVGEKCLTELKVRNKNHHPERYESWLLPYCKVKRASTEEKDVFFFYYWTSTGELFVLPYDSEVFSKFKPYVPEFHADQQLHVKIPRKLWEKITIEAS